VRRPEETPPGADERRWADGAGAGEREARAGALLRGARGLEALSAARLSAVRHQVSEARSRARRPWAIQLAFAVALIFGLSTIVVAATKVTGWFRARERERAVAPSDFRAASKPPRHGRRSEAPTPPPGEPAAEPAPAAVETPLGPVAGPPAPPPAPVAPPRAHGASVKVSRPAPAEPPPPPAIEPPPQRPPGLGELALNDPHAPAGSRSVDGVDHSSRRAGEDEAPRPSAIAPASPLAEESALLARALRVLRQENDPAGALRLFDEHAARFARGPLATEERIGRVEALLQLGRRDEALALLDPMTLPSKGRRRDMLVTRGELRARAGRCAEALIDFGLALTNEARDDDAAERALYGRGSCRARLGDSDGARSDLMTYLARFPSGHFAADVRAMLRP
jgi:hypothetical protein